MESKSYKHISKDNDIYISPKDGKHTETLIFMHGLGDTAMGWFDVFYNEDMTPCRPTTKVVLLTAPTAPVSLNFGMKMPSWYDIKTLEFNPSAKFEDTTGIDEVLKNTERIQKVIAEEIAALNGESQKVFIGGFSQGCAMALYSGLSYDKTLGGIMGFSGYLFPILIENEKNSKIPIYLSHGKDDPLIPFQLSNKSFEKLKETDHPIKRVHVTGLGHSINGTVLEEAKTWFSNVLGKK